MGGVRLNLPEFTWLMSCSIVSDHYLFQCLTAVFFLFLQEAGGRKLSMATEYFQRTRHALSFSVYYRDCMVGPEKFSK